MSVSEAVPIAKDDPFKVIIVGGGVSSLTLAHCLDQANIDYVILEKGIVAPPWGTSISIHPNGCRILHQLGCLDAVQAKCVPMERFYNRNSSGKSFVHDYFFHSVKSRTGYTTLTIERQTYLQALYDQLRDKSKVHERSRVVEIFEENGSVRVVLEDNTEHIGDLVVGADGVHSTVRELMWKKANETIPGYISAAEKRSMKTTYNAIIACVPMQPGLGLNHMHSTSFDKFSFLMLCQPETIFLAAHFKLPEDQQTRWPNRTRYTKEDMDALAAKVADCPVSESVLFGELWRKRTRAHIVALEEGVLEHWFFGRTVLLGDSAHKYTPNAGFGGSTGMESAVVLANEIRRALSAHPNKKPSDIEIRDAIQIYQVLRKSRVTEIFWVSWALTRLQAYDGWYMYLVQRWILPVLGLDFVGKQVAQSCCEAPQLDYVPFDQYKGTLAWKEKGSAIKVNKATTKKTAWDGDVEQLLLVAFGMLLVFSSALWFVGKDARHALAGVTLIS